VTFFMRGGQFSGIICIISSGVCTLKIIKVGCFLTEIFKSTIVDVLKHNVHLFAICRISLSSRKRRHLVACLLTIE